MAPFCEARQIGRQHEFPIKQKKLTAHVAGRQLLIISQEGHSKILFWQRPQASRRLAGFWELPEPGQLADVQVGEQVGRFRHSIVNTSYRFEVLVGFLPSAPEGFTYLARQALDEVPLSTTAKKALACLHKREQSVAVKAAGV